MRFRPLVVLVTLLSLLLAIMPGCQAGFEAGAYIDDAGREVNIEEVPQRIVTFGPSITEIAFALGLGERVVGADDYSDYPAEAQDLPRIGSAWAPSIESLAELEPDLVLTVEHVQFNSDMDALGIPYLILDPDDIDGILGDIELVGAVTGAVDEAAELIESMEATIAEIEELVGGVSPVSVFFIVDATDPTLPWTAGPGSFIDALITLAGGENVAGSAADAWPQFSIEEVVNADPEVIIVQTMTGGVPTISVESLKEHPIWGGLVAVLGGNVFPIDGDLVSRSGPRIVQGLEALAEALHPELFD